MYKSRVWPSFFPYGTYGTLSSSPYTSLPFIPYLHSLYITDDVLCVYGKQGNAKYGTSTSVIYNELEGLTNLLKYSAIPIGCCGIVLHPQWGRGAYPVTLFTTAPLDVLKKASLTLHLSHVKASHSSLPLKGSHVKVSHVKVSHVNSHP